MVAEAELHSRGGMLTVTSSHPTRQARVSGFSIHLRDLKGRRTSLSTAPPRDSPCPNAATRTPPNRVSEVEEISNEVERLGPRRVRLG